MKTWIIFIIIFIILSLGFQAVKYKYMYEEAIKIGADSTVTAMEMVVACQQIGNVTIEDVREQYIKTFILNRTKEKP